MPPSQTAVSFQSAQACEISVSAGFTRNTLSVSPVKVTIVKVYKKVAGPIVSTDFNSPVILVHNNSDDNVIEVPVIFPNNVYQENLDVIIPGLKNGVTYYFRYKQLGKLDTTLRPGTGFTDGARAHGQIVPYGEAQPPVIMSDSKYIEDTNIMNLKFKFGAFNGLKPNGALIIYAREPSAAELAGTVNPFSPITVAQQASNTIFVPASSGVSFGQDFELTHPIPDLVKSARYHFQVQAITGYDAVLGTGSASDNSNTLELTLVNRPDDVLLLEIIEQTAKDLKYRINYTLNAKTSQEYYNIYQETYIDSSFGSGTWTRGAIKATIQANLIIAAPGTQLTQTGTLTNVQYGVLARVVAIPFTLQNDIGSEKLSLPWLSKPALTTATALNKCSVTIENSNLIDGVGSSVICVTYSDTTRPDYDSLVLNLDADALNNGLSSVTALLEYVDPYNARVINFVADSNNTAISYKATARINVNVNSTAITLSPIQTWYSDIVYNVKSSMVRGLFNRNFMDLANNLTINEKGYGIALCNTANLSSPATQVPKTFFEDSFIRSLTLTQIPTATAGLFNLNADVVLENDTFDVNKYASALVGTLVTDLFNTTPTKLTTLSAALTGTLPTANNNIVTKTITFLNNRTRSYRVEASLKMKYINPNNINPAGQVRQLMVEKYSATKSEILALFTPPTIQRFQSTLNAASTTYRVRIHNEGSAVNAVNIVSIPDSLSNTNSIEGQAGPSLNIVYPASKITGVGLQETADAVEVWSVDIPYRVLTFSNARIDYAIVGNAGGHDKANASTN